MLELELQFMLLQDKNKCNITNVLRDFEKHESLNENASVTKKKSQTLLQFGCSETQDVSKTTVNDALY